MSVMTELQVGLDTRSYPIWIGAGILERLAELLDDRDFPRRLAVVSNPVVAGLYAERLAAGLTAAGYRVERIIVPEGEEHKNLDTYRQIMTSLIEAGFDRQSGLIALGGGVIGDLTGFVAATYLRGVPFIQVPTSLLAQVDSSVGGKTGVNHPLGKNLIGAFYQPRAVLIDVETLTTLPAREFRAGMAEVVKYGVIRDRDFFDWLADARQRILQFDRDALVHLVEKSCQTKADIVESDEKEKGLRAILNYGHTFGHAVETLAGYGEVRHGEAVAMGMKVAAEIARRKGYCRTDEVRSLCELLRMFKLPLAPPEMALDELVAAMLRDKKVQGGRLRLVLNVGIGDCRIDEIDDPHSLFAAVLSH